MAILYVRLLLGLAVVGWAALPIDSAAASPGPGPTNLAVADTSAPVSSPWASSADTSDVEWSTSLPPLTVTATRVPTTAAQVPARVDVLDSTAIAQTGATSVAELLEERAGLFIRQYGAGGLSTVSLRGTGASQTAVLLDGHRIGDPQLGQLDLSLLPTILLSSVEVMHGPASPLYGSDGMGGAIHLRSIQPQGPRSVKVSGQAGAFGMRGTSVLASRSRGATSIVAAAEYRHTDGDFPYTNTALFPPQTVRRQNADRERLSLYSAVRSRLGDHRLRVAGWLTDAERGLPGTRTRSPEAERQWDTQLRLWADDTVQPSWGTLTVSGLLQRSRLRYVNAAQDIDDTGRNTLSSLEVTARVPASDHWMVTSGLTGSAAWAHHPNLDTDAREQHAAAFASAVASYGRVRLYPAFRTDAYWMPGAPTRVAVSPRLGLTVQPFDASPSLSWKLHAGRAFRAPTLNDRYWQPGGTPDLRPEHGWSLDTGVRWDGPAGQVELTTFATWQTDQIVWRPVEAGVWSPANLDRVRALGVEASAQRSWHLPFGTALQTGLTYAFTDARDRSDPSSPTYNQPLRYVPREQIKTHATLAWGPAALDVNARYTGRRYITSDASQSLEPYAIVDLQLRINGRWNGIRAQLSTGVDNLFDTDYRAVGNRPMPPRHLQLRLSLSY